MLTVILSQVLGVVRLRLLGSVFGLSDTLGVYLASSRFPDLLFQIIVAGALYSAFIPVFNDFLSRGQEKEANRMASTLLLIGLAVFTVLSVILFIFAPLFLQLINLGSGFSDAQMSLMADLMRIMIAGQIIFLLGSFFSALLQSHNHFFIPGIALALYNLGIIVGIITLSDKFGIFAPAYGVILGSLIFVLLQIPLIKRVGFNFRPEISIRTPGVPEVIKLMWPRTLSLFVFHVGAIIILSLISFLPSPGRNYALFDYAQTLFFAPIALFGQTVAQAAFPVLAKEKDKINEFRATFLSSTNQILYLVLPASALLLVLRIPIVRLIYGAGKFDWDATVLIGRILAFFALSIFAQALIGLISRAFYALHDTKTPLIIGAFSTVFTLTLSMLFIFILNDKIVAANLYEKFRLVPSGVEGIALSYSLAGIVNVFILLIYLNKKIGGIFSKELFFLPQVKIFTAAFFMAIALYIPIKLLDQLVFDTTRTINLILLTGISSFAGFSLYLFLTWFFNVKEATTFLLLFKRIGNWKEILGKSERVIDSKV